MRYQAKLVKIESADPGFYYPTYEYTDNGQTKQITDKHAITISPWDWTNTHTINVNQKNEIDNNNYRGFIIGLCIFAAFFLFANVAPAIPDAFFGLLFITLSVVPIILIGKSRRLTTRRCNSAKFLYTIEGKIVWYKEVIKRRNNSSKTYHYPVVDYLYNGKKYSAVLPEHEEPLHEGELRRFYLDVNNQDVFTDKSCKHSDGVLSIIFTLFFTVPFMLAGIGIMAPDLMNKLSLTISQNAVKPDNATIMIIGQCLPVIVISVFLLALSAPIIIEIKGLCTAKYARCHGTSLCATLVKTNDYGRRDVSIYSYAYQGQIYKYQSQTLKDQTIEIYVHPKSCKAYSKNDITMHVVKLCILLGILFMVALMGPLAFKGFR